ncbi:hypothetical protein IKN40_07930 [bacterium]|nr:hypothetical protein [bacterium]
MKKALKFGILEIEFLKRTWRKYGRDFGNEILHIQIAKVFDYDFISLNYLLKNNDFTCSVKVKNENELLLF